MQKNNDKILVEINEKVLRIESTLWLSVEHNTEKRISSSALTGFLLDCSACQFHSFRRHTCTFRDAPVALHEGSQARSRLHRGEGRLLNKFDGVSLYHGL